MNERANTASERVPVGVVGARGYSGLELCRLLLRHPQARLAACFATAGFRLSDFLPEKEARAVPALGIEHLLESVRDENLKVVFLATPVEVSLELAPKLLEAGVHVIDLSGAFRLQAGTAAECAATYKQWYGVAHHSIDLLKRAEFGLVPWVSMAQAKPEKLVATSETSSSDGAKFGARLVSNPGCFATAILMALIPLLKAGVIDPHSIVIDAKSGTSGAGRKAEERLMHAEVDGACLPYRVGRHQHEPEIQQYAEVFGGVRIDPYLTTHLLNVRRGIIAGVYSRSAQSLAPEETASCIADAYHAAYAENPLVEVAKLGAGGDVLLNLRRVVGSARTHIAYEVVRDRVYVFSLIDNLLKGAASQAVENFNRIMGAPTWLGLDQVEGVL